MTLRSLSPVAAVATFGLAVGLTYSLAIAGSGVALAQAGDDKPTIDSDNNMGISRDDVSGLGKDEPAAAPPPPRAEPAPAPAPRRAAPAPAPAPHRGLFAGNPYLWGSVGWVDAEDSDLSGAVSGEADLGQWAHFGGALGWHFDNGLRAEVEGNYYNVDINDVNGSPVDGEHEVIAGMFNLIYELPMLRYLKPYAGAGVGIASVDNEISRPPSAVVSGDDTVLAWQFIGGTAVAVTRSIALTFDYRYFETEDVDFAGIEAETTAHKALAGIRYTFGVN